MRPHIPAYFDTMSPDLDELHRLCSQPTGESICPSAPTIEQRIPVYSGQLFEELSNVETHRLKEELCTVLRDGPGVFAVTGAYPVLDVVDRCTEVFRQVVEEERRSGLGAGDHFGQNERIWNSLQKVCLKDPDLFIDYYGNPVLALASEAWLGPSYQVTAQMNNVRPGSTSQSVHRDYHLGFQSDDTIARFPAHAQTMSQFLTLQGAVAHSDMPVESGPTLLLPYSHLYEAGYATFRHSEVQAYFDKHHAQLPLSRGDMLFFSPAVLHAAGENRSDSDRIANLLQVSSAFGKTMESLDKRAMVEAIYPVLLARKLSGKLPAHLMRNAIAAAADGYAFPTNLDLDPPVDGNAPETAQSLVERALNEGWSIERLRNELTEYGKRRKS